MPATGYISAQEWYEADILSTQAKCMRYREDIRLEKPNAKKAYDFKATDPICPATEGGMSVARF